MSSTVWQCRICGRRIPLRVDECFCGAKREQVVAQEKREADRSPAKIPLDVALLVALVVLVGVFGVHYALRSETAPAAGGRNLLSGMLATPGPVPTPTPTPSPNGQTAEPVSAPPAIAAPTPEADPALPPSLPPTLPLRPAASPSPSPQADELEQKKTAALGAYAAELERLAATSSRMADHTRAYQAGCVGQNVAVHYTNCPEMEAAIRKALGEVEQGLDAAEEQARRSWVEPGKLRDARSRTVFGKRDWEEIQRAARQVGR